MRISPIEEREEGGRVALKGGRGEDGVNDVWC